MSCQLSLDPRLVFLVLEESCHRCDAPRSTGVVLPGSHSFVVFAWAAHGLVSHGACEEGGSFHRSPATSRSQYVRAKRRLVVEGTADPMLASLHRPSAFQKKMEGSQENVFTARLERSDAVVGASQVLEAFAEAPGSPPPVEKKRGHGVKRPARPPQPFFDGPDDEDEPSVSASLGSVDSEEEVDLFAYLARFRLTKEEKIRILRKCASALAASCSKQIKRTRAIARSRNLQQ